MARMTNSKYLTLGGYLVLTLLSQDATANMFSEHCDLYFSNQLVLKNVPIAKTQKELHTGLSKRNSAGSGMLFSYPDSAPRVFWMHETYVPLSIGFFDENGLLFQVTDMEPNTDTLHYSIKPAQDILELAKGGFKKVKLAPGIRLEMKVCQEPITEDKS